MKLFMGLTMELEVALVLRARDVLPTTLRESSSLGRLGWDSYMVEGPRQANRGDVAYRLLVEDSAILQ